MEKNEFIGYALGEKKCGNLKNVRFEKKGPKVKKQDFYMSWLPSTILLLK